MWRPPSRGPPQVVFVVAVRTPSEVVLDLRIYFHLFSYPSESNQAPTAGPSGEASRGRNRTQDVWLYLYLPQLGFLLHDSGIPHDSLWPFKGHIDVDHNQCTNGAYSPRYAGLVPENMGSMGCRILLIWIEGSFCTTHSRCKSCTSFFSPLLLFCFVVLH